MADLADGLAAALVESFAMGDPTPLCHMAPGAIIWHNSDHKEMDALTALAGVTRLHEMVDGLRVDILRDEPFREGQLISFAVRGAVRASGRELNAHNCVLFTISGAGVERMDEYVDPSLRAQLTADGHLVT